MYTRTTYQQFPALAFQNIPQLDLSTCTWLGLPQAGDRHTCACMYTCTCTCTCMYTCTCIMIMNEPGHSTIWLWLYCSRVWFNFVKLQFSLSSCALANWTYALLLAKDLEHRQRSETSQYLTNNKPTSHCEAASHAKVNNLIVLCINEHEGPPSKLG